MIRFYGRSFLWGLPASVPEVRGFTLELSRGKWALARQGQRLFFVQEVRGGFRLYPRESRPAYQGAFLFPGESRPPDQIRLRTDRAIFVPTDR